jgi:S1-C subfamily serine protease
MDARILARDEATDLALLAIDRPVPALEFGGDAKFGERACAIGHPFGFGLAVTCGVVSAVHKAGAGFNPIEDFVQTDAAVNPGMSGGALVRTDGTLIGILTSIFTRGADGNLGVNFAVAAPLARRVAEDLAADGRVARLPTGMRLVPAIGRGETGRLAARVASVREGSAAAAAGLAVDDLIVRAGDRVIHKPADFISATGRLRPGESLDLTVLRGDESRTATLTLAGP